MQTQTPESNYHSTRYEFVKESDPSAHDGRARQLFEFLEKSGLNKPSSLLDLGCGAGDLCSAVQRQVDIPVAGIELDATLVSLAKKSGLENVTQGNVLDPIPSLFGKYNVVTAFEILEHLRKEDHSKVLENFRKYGSEQGWGVIMVPNAANPLIGNFMAWSDYTHLSFFTPESLVQLIRENGFTDVHLYPWVVAKRPLIKMIRTNTIRALGILHKTLAGMVTSIPRSKDPAVSDPIPFSSHIIAVFKLNS